MAVWTSSGNSKLFESLAYFTSLYSSSFERPVFADFFSGAYFLGIVLEDEPITASDHSNL